MPEKNEPPSQDNLRLQYIQCLENYRHYDKFIWQIPQLTTLIITAVIGVSFGYLEDMKTAQLAVLLFGLLLTITMYIVIRKMRFFQHWDIDLLRKIESSLWLNPMPLVTNKDGAITFSWIEKQSGQKWMANILLVMAGILLILIFFISLELSL